MFHNTQNCEQAIYLCSKTLWAMDCVICNVSSLILFWHKYANNKHAQYNQKIHMAHQSISHSTCKTLSCLSKHIITPCSSSESQLHRQVLMLVTCEQYLCLSVLGISSREDISSVYQCYARLWVLWFRTMLSQANQSMDCGPGFNFSCIYYFCHGLHAKWIRKPKVVIHLDKSLSIWYSNEDIFNIVNVKLTVVINLPANKIGKNTWEWCCMIKWKHVSWRFTKKNNWE